MRLRYILFLALSGVAVLPVVGLATWIYGQALDKEIGDVTDKHLVIAKNIGRALDRYSIDLRNGFELVAEEVIAKRPTEGFFKFMKTMNFVHLCVADLNSGKITDEISPKDLPCPNKVPAARFRAFISLIQPNAVAFSPVMKNPKGHPTIYLLGAYGDKLVIGAVSTDYIVAQGKAVAFGKKGHAAIVDENGNLIYHPLPTWRLSMKNLAKVPPVQRMMEKKTGVMMFYSPAVKADMIAGYTVVPTTGWGVMVPQPFAEIRAAAKLLQISAVGVSVAAVMLAGLLSWFLSGFLTRSLSAVVDTSHRMANREFGARVEMKSGFKPSEINELGSTFNIMADVIDETNNNLSKAVKAANAASRAKSEFLSSMSHELRTPMNSILGFSQLLASDTRTALTDIQERAIGNIHKSGQHLMELINQVLELNKIEAGKIALSLETVSVREVIGDCLASVRMRAEEAGVTLADHLAEQDLPPLRADATRLRQVLLNLLSNAIKYNTEGGEVAVACQPVESGMLRIMVSDTGLGIPADQQNKLFLPFERLGREAGEIEGSGVGLTITKQIIELMGGHIGFESEEGKGSTFWVDVPVSGKKAISKRQRALSKKAKTAAPDTGAAPPRSFLYIEDNPSNLELMEMIIDMVPNATLIAARTAELGLDLAVEKRPDLILMDINLPGMNGMEALKKLKASTATKDIPVVAISAAAMPKDIEAALEAGFKHYLTKPLNVDETKDVISVILATGVDN